MEKVGKKCTLTLSINSQKVYDEFGLATYIRDYALRDGSYVVGLMTYVYNSEGNLVASKNSYLSNLNTTEQTFENFVEGKYTVITIEMLVNPEDGYKADTWSIDDTNSISTIKITEKVDEPDENGNVWSRVAYSDEVIGVETREIILNSDKLENIEPHGIGSVVRFYQYNFDKSGVSMIGWATDDVLDYYSLNPSVSRNNRYVKHLTGEHKTHVRRWFETDKNPDNYIWHAYVLEADMDWKIIWQNPGQDGVSPGNKQNATLNDGKTYHLGCYYFNDGTYDTFFGDSKSAVENWKKQCDSKNGSTTPVNSLYKAPYTDWSVGTVSAVKSFMSGLTLYEDVTKQDDGKYQLTYVDASNKNVIYMYSFNYSSSGLTDCYVGLSPNNFTLSQVQDYLKSQGYTNLGGEDDMYSYSNSTTGVLLIQGSSTIIVNYYDLSAYSSSSRAKAPDRLLTFKNAVDFITKSSSINSLSLKKHESAVQAAFMKDNCKMSLIKQ